eukprot:2486181-Pleurochrysis_carterae.AAC.11
MAHAMQIALETLRLASMYAAINTLERSISVLSSVPLGPEAAGDCRYGFIQHNSRMGNCNATARAKTVA